MTSLIIYCRGSDDFSVHQGEVINDWLNWHELLGVVAGLSHPSIGTSPYLASDTDRILWRAERYGQRKGRPPVSRTFTIYGGANHFDVFEGERFTQGLCWDEMLGHIAVLTCPFVHSSRRERGIFRVESLEQREREKEAERLARLGPEAGDCTPF